LEQSAASTNVQGRNSGEGVAQAAELFAHGNGPTSPKQRRQVCDAAWEGRRRKRLRCLGVAPQLRVTGAGGHATLDISVTQHWLSRSRSIGYLGHAALTLLISVTQHCLSRSRSIDIAYLGHATLDISVARPTAPRPDDARRCPFTRRATVGMRGRRIACKNEGVDCKKDDTRAPALLACRNVRSLIAVTAMYLLRLRDMTEKAAQHPAAHPPPAPPPCHFPAAMRPRIPARGRRARAACSSRRRLTGRSLQSQVLCRA
jgi:hypothetical protein